MPRLSDTMQQGTVVKWNVKEGDAVKAGDVLADIETDKATMELESFDAGTVAALVAKEGQNVAVGAVIVALAGKDENAAEVKAKYGGAAAAPQAAGAKAQGAAKAPPVTAKASAGATAPVATPAFNGSAGGATAIAEPPMDRAGGGAEGRVFASPLARKVADDLGVDLARVTGTGPSGRITKADVEAAVGAVETAAHSLARAATAPGIPGASGPKAPSPSKPALATPIVAAPAMRDDLEPLEDSVVPLSNMRRTIARRLVESKQSIPHYQVTVAVNMDPLLTLREQLNSQLAAQGVKLSVNDFLVRACALAMHQHPHVNASWDAPNAQEPTIRVNGRVNIGVAIALPIERGGGLVVATLRDADRIGLRSISAQTKALSEKARTKGLTIEEQSESTFTISNLGMFGVEHFTAIINPPNSAILAVGAAVKKPVVRPVNGMDQVVIGHEMQMTMSSDHRVIDGAMAAQYLSTVKQLLEGPAALLV